MTLLKPGDQFPRLTITALGGNRLDIREHLGGHFGAVLFYRGAWCPYCNAQLSAFQRAHDRLEQSDIRVVALSVDDEAAGKGLAAKHGLTFPIGYGADASAVAAQTGAFVNPDPPYLQSTGFVLAPDGTVIVSVYSSGAIGRLLPNDVAGLVDYVRTST